MREIDRFVSMLFPQGGRRRLVDLKFFPGEEPVTVEEFCAEVHSAFLQVDTGQSGPLPAFQEDVKKISVDRFLAVA